jgi:phosphoribosyl-ATP pyrophosphohydrolase
MPKKEAKGAPPAPDTESPQPAPPAPPGAGPPDAGPPDATVLDRLYGVVFSRRKADPATSHSARLLSRGVPKVAQKFGEEAVECLIEAVAGNRAALIGESADVLYHLLVMWTAAGVRPDEVWAELARREGVSGIAEKAARSGIGAMLARKRVRTAKIP